MIESQQRKHVQQQPSRLYADSSRHRQCMLFDTNDTPIRCVKVRMCCVAVPRGTVTQRGASSVNEPLLNR